MMSCAWGLRLMGIISDLSPGSPHLAFIRGVRELVAQVSITSNSGVNSPEPQ